MVAVHRGLLFKEPHAHHRLSLHIVGIEDLGVSNKSGALIQTQNSRVGSIGTPTKRSSCFVTMKTKRYILFPRGHGRV